MPKRKHGGLEKGFVIVVVCIISFICFSGWYSVVIPWSWWNTPWGLINMAFSHGIMILIFMNYFKAHLTDPGRVPEGWRPDYATVEEQEKARDQEIKWQKARRTKKFIPKKRVWGPTAVRWCYQCEEFKPPRAHHCRDCGHCTLKMDHHCPWVATCVGAHNHKYFMGFLFNACVGLTYAAIVFGIRLVGILTTLSSQARARREASDSLEIDEINNFPVVAISHIAFVTISMIIVVPITLSLWCLFSYQVSLIARNLTTIEEYEHRVLKRRAKKKGERFRWHYTMGCKRNWEQVFGEQPLQWFLPYPVSRPLDGLSWPTNTKYTV